MRRQVLASYPFLNQSGEPTRRFDIVLGDLLAEDVDAIVNAANSHLAHGGGVAGVIARAAGDRLWDEGDALIAKQGPVPTGEAVVTGAGNLIFEGIIHAVGPRQGYGREEELLTSAIMNSLLRAHERAWKSVAFPAVSSGIFAVPLPVCARAYAAGVQSFFSAHPDSSLVDVRLVVLDRAIGERTAEAMDAGQ
jgi:O-acetyl-ADP-ribose deacetylase (regulator of RNase III)